jgi:hypothetical protein
LENVMTKRRVSDVLRAEVQPILSADTPASEHVSETPSIETDSKDIDAAPVDVVSEPEVDPPQAVTPVRRSTPTKAELETQVAELQQALASAQDHETQLQEKITYLQSEQRQQQAQVQKMQAELKTVNQLQQELAEAKEMIRKLAVVQPPEPPNVPKPAQPMAEPIRKSGPLHKISTTPGAPRDLRSQRQLLQSPLPRPIWSSEPPSSKQDIDTGWVD